MSAVTREIELDGQVQGVGFRPFVYNLAQRHALTGWVVNLKGRVRIQVSGDPDVLDQFADDLVRLAPAIARPHIRSVRQVGFADPGGFKILTSDSEQQADIHIPPDYALCDACAAELDDPNDRRFRYAFNNCTQCGPRFTIIRALPYDRRNTSMAAFKMCKCCAAEYHDPGNRRFHAEPVACPACGPQLSFSSDGIVESDPERALERTIKAIRDGHTVAVKGVGGYHLVCDARSQRAVANLRLQKNRPHKPLAVLVTPDWFERHVNADDVTRSLIMHTARPIVLCDVEPGVLADGITMGMPSTGLFLPYSPLHQRLLQSFDGPLVATSANLSGEPVLTDNVDVETRLGGVCSAYLHHNRAIVRPADDSVFNIIAGKARPMRLGRGYSPYELTLPFELAEPILAVGGQMKNTIALGWNNRMVMSSHIGELTSPRSLSVFENAVTDLQQLYEVDASVIACDAHPGYASHRWAMQQSSAREVIEIFHHHAHAGALTLENPAGDKPWLVFAWDGTGFGEDGTIWGGETLLGVPGNWRRVASFRPFRLPGGDRVSREPWRSAASLCWHSEYNAYNAPKYELLHSAWLKGINALYSSAAGRLFDGASALCGICEQASFEGQAAMLLEAYADSHAVAETLEIYHQNGILLADWRTLPAKMSDDSLSLTDRASWFHATLAETLVEIARRCRETYGDFRIGLTGGVFQNRCLAEQALKRTAESGFETVLPQQLPCNDAAISAGQIIEVHSRR